MKKTLAMILSIALALSLLTVGFVFTASADAIELPNPDAIWDETEASYKATSVELRAGRLTGSTGVILSAENPTVDIAANEALLAAWPYQRGTLTFDNGVLTIADLVLKDGVDTSTLANDQKPNIVGYGALKVIISGDFFGVIRNDEINTNNAAGSLFITGDEVNGGFWTNNAWNDAQDENNFRNYGSLYVYGNLGFDIVGSLFGYGSGLTAYFAPSKDSKWDIHDEKPLFPRHGSYVSEYANLIFAGDAKIEVGATADPMFAWDANFTPDIIIDSADVTFGNPEDTYGWGESGSDRYDIYGAPIYLQNGATLNLAHVYHDAVTTEEAFAQQILDKITLDENTCTVYARGEYKLGYDPASVELPDGLKDQGGTKDITLTYVPMTENDQPSYYVDVEWTDLTFAYTAAGAGTWTPSEHAYKGSSVEKWEVENDNVTVTNHSNREVNVSLTLESDVTFAITANDVAYEAPVAADAAGGVVVFDLQPSGSLNGEDGKTEAIGTVTVKFAPVA